MEEAQEHSEKEKVTNRFGKFHDKNYKLLLLIPAALLLIGFIYMGIFYSAHHDFIYRDISLTGGTSVTVYQALPPQKILTDLSPKLEDMSVRQISSLTTGKEEAVIVNTKANSTYTKQVLQDYLGYNLTTDNSSIEFTGSTLSQSFFQQLMIAVLIAFVFMALVVFIIFRTFVPSAAVIISAFADIFMTLIVVDAIGVRLSTAGIVAFLMLIGYSVDTDILLTTRVLKRQGNLNGRIFSAFKTGITMTLTSIIAVGIAWIFANSFSGVLSQILMILFIGLAFDMLNTWVTNVSLLKWYVHHKNEN